jgi:SAM-dependent MidA family methyltransferase
VDAGKPTSWRILEIGAHDGKLGADVVQTIANLAPDAWQALEYATVEPLPLLREAQQKRLSSLAAKFSLACDFQTLSENPLPGIAFGNEILDALPFHLIRCSDNEWQELYVSANGELIARPIALKPRFSAMSFLKITKPRFAPTTLSFSQRFPTASAMACYCSSITASPLLNTTTPTAPAAPCAPFLNTKPLKTR